MPPSPSLRWTVQWPMRRPGRGSISTSAIRTLRHTASKRGLVSPYNSSVVLFTVLALGLQPVQAEDEVLRWAALLARPETRARGVDRLSHADPERLRRVPDLDPDLLRAAEENAALRHSYGPPRLFSLDGQEQELDDVLQRLERAAGFTFQRSSLQRGAKISLRLDGVSAWEALSELGRSASFAILGVDGPSIYLSQGVPVPRPRAWHGPLMIELERISRRTRVGFDATRTDVWMRLAVWWEPHVLPLEVPATGVITKAVDDRGRVLGRAPPSAPRKDLLPRVGHATVTLEGLEPPAENARTLTIEGAFDLRFPSKVSRSTFEASGRAAHDGLSLEAKIGEGATGVWAEVAVVFEDPARAAAYKPTIADVVFDSDAAVPGPRASLSSVAVDGPRVSYTVRTNAIRRLADLRRIHVRVPEGSVTKRVPFRFENVDLR
jgi:hypothetical protein